MSVHESASDFRLRQAAHRAELADREREREQRPPIHDRRTGRLVLFRRWSRCPRCGLRNRNPLKTKNLGGDMAEQDRRCPACGTRWQEIWD